MIMEGYGGSFSFPFPLLFPPAKPRPFKAELVVVVPTKLYSFLYSL